MADMDGSTDHSSAGGPNDVHDTEEREHSRSPNREIQPVAAKVGEIQPAGAKVRENTEIDVAPLSRTPSTSLELENGFKAAAVAEEEDGGGDDIEFVNVDSSESGTDSRSRRRSRRGARYREEIIISPREETQVFQMHQDRPGKDPSAATVTSDKEPPVLWRANIFDTTHRRRNRSRGRPAAIYYDDRPFDLSPDNSKNSSISGAELLMGGREPAEDMNHPRWEGCVFEINTDAFALLPKSAPRYQYARRHSPIGRLPRRIDSLKIDQLSRFSMVIRSPFLYLGLRKMVKYYPSFYGKKAGYLSDISHPKPPSERSDFVLWEPYAVLMHHFPEIEAFASGDEPKPSTEKEKIQPEQDSSFMDEVRQLQKEHMRHLYGYLKPLYHASVLSCQRHLSESPPRVAFDMMWYLFKPGTDVYIRKDGMVHACVVSDVTNNLDNHVHLSHHVSGDIRFWTLELWCLDTDGSQVARTLTSTTIYPYSGLLEVTKLEACPVAIWDASDGGERRQKILTRSKLLVKALQQGSLLARYNGPGNQGNRYYTGTVVIDHRRGLFHQPQTMPVIGQVKDHCSDFTHYDRIFVNKHQDLSHETWDDNPSRDISYGRVEYDVRRRPEYEPRVVVRRRSSSAASLESAVDALRPEVLDDDSSSLRKELDEHQLLLLYPSTRGFALKTKQWMTVSADHISEVVSSEESIQNLVLGPDELKTVRALSNRHSSKNETWAADFIEGKGSGQIILLHGPPGVGKTYTVEAIAEWLHRPLLALTVADIGTAETRIEGELVKWFTLAEAWNAVLLVDEADIFLEKRQNRDLARNGLVSAFLRRMEYFKGLLFLTTNRVGQIDDAFISRVHVAIGYRALTGEDRKKIWAGFFRKLVKDRAGKIQIAPDAKKWVLDMAVSGQEQLNGRDIRNALQTAITLAESDCEEDPDFDSSKETIIVLQSHFQRVLDISTKFHNYVASIRREDEKKRAAGRGDRNDYLDLPLDAVQLR